LTAGIGFTVIVKVVGEPVHVCPVFVKVGVTVIVAVTGADPALDAVNAAIVPVPLAPRPMDTSELVQVNVPPGTDPENVTVLVEAPLQTAWFDTGLTVGPGFTVIVKNAEVPLHVSPALVIEGVTVIVATTGLVPALFAGNDMICPIPLAASSMVGSELVQL